MEESHILSVAPCLGAWINDDLHREAEARETLVLLHLTMLITLVLANNGSLIQSLRGQKNKQSRHKDIISPGNMKLSLRQTKGECHTSSITNKRGCMLPRGDQVTTNYGSYQVQYAA